MKWRALTFLWTLLGMLAASRLRADSWQENFSSDPLRSGWCIYGDTHLYQWDAVNQAMAVTWDSSQTNSYFYHPLGTILTKDDDFGFVFDLRLEDIAVGVNPGQPYTFELAVGLLNLAVATVTNYERGTVNSLNGARNICEFDYFPDSGYGATVSPTLVSTNSQYNQFATVFAYPLTLDPGALFTVAMNYTSSNQTLRTSMTRNGVGFGPIPDVVLGAGFADFRLDQFAVCGYRDAGADGSLLAHGVIDRVSVTVPPPPVLHLAGFFTNQLWQVRFLSRSNWIYTLQRSTDFQTWTNLWPSVAGNATNLWLMDSHPPLGAAFYRLLGGRP